MPKNKLTILQQRFIDALFAMEVPNNRQAYIQAGYKARGKTADVEACKTLKIPKVKAYLNKLRDKASDKAQVTGIKVIKEFSKIAFSNIKDYIWIDDEGELHFKPFDEIDEDKLAAVESVKVRTNTTTNKKGDKEYTTTTIEFKLYNKQTALENIGKHLGIYQTSDEPKKDEIYNILQIWLTKIDGSGTKTPFEQIRGKDRKPLLEAKQSLSRHK